MSDICIFGPVSKDVIYHGPVKAMESVGGVPVYAGLTAARLRQSLQIITKWAASDDHRFDILRNEQSIRLRNIGSSQTTSFELTYDSDHETDRQLRLTAIAEPFQVEDLKYVEAELLYLAPLMQGDMDATLIRKAAKTKRLALDVQGLLRQAKDGLIKSSDWPEKLEALPSVGILKASHVEAACLTGEKDPVLAAQQIAAWGVGEVIITRDRWGAHVLAKGEAVDIPAFEPIRQTDSTGCGDTFFAAYLSKRLDGEGITQAGTYAAAVAALKIGVWGPSQAEHREIAAFMTSGSRLPLSPNGS